MTGTRPTAVRAVHPPGTILQHMYIEERLARLRPGHFLEVGVGNGHISQLLLARGWSGVGYDLSDSALARAAEMNDASVARGRLVLHNEDWLQSEGPPSPVDLVISSMVLEHLDDHAVKRYFERSASALAPGGRSVLIVPGSPRHWGIEDEIAGHHRRYTIDSLSDTASTNGWRVTHIAGLAYPLANLTLKLSNALVRRGEQDRAALSLQERTERSGDRSVAWKTDFPSWVGALVNRRTLRPFHWWQKRSSNNPAALVIYCECIPPAPV